MDPRDVVNGDDEEFAFLLARYSEALSAGRDADPASDPALSAELRQRLQRALSCLRRLRQFRPRPPIADAITLVMETDDTLHDGIVGGRVGRFHIERTLGYGGGGIVFLASDPDLHREVALKIPHMPALLVPDLRRRFMREARAAARLDHPNLVPVHEVGEANGVCFIVSAYCRGGSLANWLKQRTTPVPFRQAAELLAVLADAVQYVHEHGIYHRDIKPGNILLDTTEARRGGELDFTPRLTDFGLAKQLDCESGLTASGTVLGTPSYMAPEQFECRVDKIGRSTDVYGLGAVLYELLTGRPPFKGATESETLDQVLTEAPVRPWRLRSGVPRDLEIICLKCLEKGPARRYASAEELAADLRRFLAGEAIQARPPKNTERLGKWMRRHPWTTTFGSFACFVFLVLLAGGSYLQALKQTHDANLAAASKQHEEHQETIRQNEQHLRLLHYAEDIAQAGRHGSQRRLSELAGRLQAYHSDELRGFEWHYLSAQARSLRWQARSPDSSLFCLAFSADGTTCATGHKDGAIRLWDRASGRMEQMPPGHKWTVLALAYSPDGKYLASAGGGLTADRRTAGELLLWDAATRKLLHVFSGLTGVVYFVAFSSDGQTLAAREENTAKLWEIPSGTLRQTIPFNVGTHCMALPSNDTIVAGHTDGRISVCNAADRRVLANWQGHKRFVQSVVCGPTSGLLVSCGRDREVRLWERNTGRPLSGYRHDGEVCGVALSPDERTIASVSRDGAVKLYDAKERGEQLLLTISSDWHQHAAFSPDGKTLAVGSEDGRLWMCDLARPAQTISWLGHRLGPVPREVWAVAFSPDGKTLASAGDDDVIRLWEPASGRLLNTLSGHQSLVTCMAFSPDGKLLASGSFDREANVKLWNAASGVEVAALPGHSKPVDALAFAPNGEMLATAGRDGVVRLWDVAAKKGRAIFTGPNIESLVFSPDGCTLALADAKESVFLLDVEGEQVLRKLPPHPNCHVAVAFSPDGRTLATGDLQGTVRFFDAATGQLLRSAYSRTHMVNCLAFSPDGKTLASAGFDKKVKLWHVATGRELLTLPEYKDRVRWLAFSPDGSMLATAGHDGILTIYRADKSEPRP